MPEEQLKVGITGDASGLEAASKQAVSSLNKIDKSAATTATSLNKIPQVSGKISQAAAQISSSAGKMGGSVAKGANEATLAMTNFGRIVQDAPFGFLGISNNLNPMLESFQRLKAETGSAGSALKAMGSSLIGAGGLGIAVSVVSTLLILFGDKLFKTGTAAEDQAAKIKKAREALDNYTDGLNDLDRSRVKGLQNAQEELVNLKTLYDATQNTNISIAQRKKLVDELQEQYPKYFANISDEIILAGGAKKAYNELATAILASAKARAAQETLVDINKQVLAVDQEVSGNAANQIKLQQQLNALKAKGLTETSATGEERLTAAGAKANKIQQQLNSFVTEGNGLLKQRNDLLSRANVLSKSISSQVEANPVALLKTGGKVEAPKVDKPKFNFLFDFLPFDPNGKMKPEQKGELLNAIDKFQKDFSGILQGALFTGTEDQRIQQAKTFDLKLKAGKVKFDTTSLQEALDKSFKPEELIPVDKLDALPTLVVDQLIRGFQNESERVKGLDLFGDLGLTNDIGKQIDLFKTRVKQLGAETPQAIEATGLQGQPITITLDDLIDTSKISNADALDALKKAFENIKGFVVNQKDGLQNAINDTLQSIEVSGLSTLGESIGEALTGGNVGDAFKAFEQMLGDAVQGLGKQIIALNVAALAAKKALKLTFANPAIGIAAGIALVAVGTALKALTSKGIKGFAKGGMVPGQGSGDTVPAMLTPGEFVVPKKFAKLAAMMFDGGFKLPKMNNNRLHFAEGGFVPNIERTSPVQRINNIINPTPVSFPDYLPVINLSYDQLRIMYQRAGKQRSIFGG
jgi:hypothetical protein